MDAGGRPEDDRGSGLRPPAQGSRSERNESDRQDSITVCSHGSLLHHRIRAPVLRGRRPHFLQRLRSGDEIGLRDHLHGRCQHSADHGAAGIRAVHQLRRCPRRSSAGHFLLTQTWDPVAGQFGALPFIYGTVVTSALALLIAVPLGVGAAIFLAELAPPRISDALTFLIELLAAVPSVIYGLLGIFVLVPHPALRRTVPPRRARMDPALSAAPSTASACSRPAWCWPS